MITHEPEDGGAAHERFEYFMVRLTRSTQEPKRVSGMIERLGSGEKHSFETGEQLVQLVYSGLATVDLQSTTALHSAGKDDATTA